MKRILISGGAGYIGSQLVHNLYNNTDYTIIIVDKGLFGYEGLEELKSVRVILHKESVSEFLQKHTLNDIDIVIHLAGLSNDPLADYNKEVNIKYNLTETEQLAEMCCEKNIRMVFASSASVYGETDFIDCPECHNIAPTSNYAWSKFEAEKVILKLKSINDKFKPVIIRKGTVMGVSKRMRFDLVVNAMVMTCIKDNRIKLISGGENWRPLVSINDVVKLYTFLIDEKIYNCFAEPYFSVYNFFGINARISELGLRIANLLKVNNVDSDYKIKDVRSYHLSRNKFDDIVQKNNLICLKNFESVETVVGDILCWISKNNPDFNDPKYFNIKFLKTIEKYAKILGISSIL